jgi:hypothetical protein
MLINCCCEGSSDRVPELGDFLSLVDVALNGIKGTGFRSTPTGVLATKRGCRVMQVLLRLSWGACIELLGDH